MKKTSKTLGIILLLSLLLTLFGCTLSDIDTDEDSSSLSKDGFITIDVKGQTLDVAKKNLKEVGFKKIKAESDSGKMIIKDSNWIVIAQDIAPDTQADKKTVITLTCTKGDKDSDSDSETQKETTTTAEEVTTTTSSPETTTTTTTTAPEKEESKYDIALKKDSGEYDLYYLIDFDSKTAVYFSTNDSSAMEGLCTGKLEKELIIKYDDSGSVFSDSLKYKSGSDSVVILLDSNGFEFEYSVIDVNKAEEELKGKKIIDYKPTDDDEPTLFESDDYSDGKSETKARRAFEYMGNYYYPYGIEFHWYTGAIKKEYIGNGVWDFEIEVTVTNEHNAKKDAIAKGKVDVANEKVTEFDIVEE